MRRKLLALTLLVITGSVPSQAEEAILWRPASPRQLKAASDVIVVGKIVHVATAAAGPDAVDVGTLRVDQVLHGAPGASQVSLRFPSHHRGTWVAGALQVDRGPSLIRYDLDQEGIFFLRSNGDGSYSANHPARFKPRFFLNKVRAQL